MEAKVSLGEGVWNKALQMIANFQVGFVGASVSFGGASHILHLELRVLSEPEVPAEVITTLNSSHVHVAWRSSFPLSSRLDTQVLGVAEDWIECGLSVGVLGGILVKIVCRALQISGSCVINLSSQILDTIVHSDSGGHRRSNSGIGDPEEVEVCAECQRVVSCLLEGTCDGILLVPGHVEQQVRGNLEHGLSITLDMEKLLWSSLALHFAFEAMMMMMTGWSKGGCTKQSSCDKRDWFCHL